MQPKVTVIIPAYNEELTIGPIINEIKNLESNYEIIVVDDCSKDATVERARAAGARVIQHPYNMGNGSAVKTGVKNAGGEYLLMMDADGQHSPEDIPKLVAGLDQYDMVVGTRDASAPVSGFRKIGNRIFVLWASYIAGRHIPDLTSGFRAVKRRRMLEFLHLLPNGFSYPSTITMALIKTGYPVSYAPLTTIVKRTKGKSKIRPFRDGLTFLMIILRMGMLFEPLKLLLPVSVFLFAMGIVVTVIQIIRVRTVTNTAVLFYVTSVLIFFFALVADQLAHVRRELNLFRKVE
ncbi:MAG: glycosyltransferase family 2 protein [Acidobacteriia bacterium]|nr:glycosyltransferase family 2 protein [Terriglobia bacterium]